MRARLRVFRVGWLVALAVAGLAAEAAAQRAARWDPIRVRGGTQKEINAALALADSRATAASPEKGGFTWSRQSPPIVLSGVFKITEPIRVPAVFTIRCEGATFFCEGLPPGQFVIDGVGWRCRITGSLSIVGAPNGFRWNTGTMSKNLTLGMCHVSGVHFAGVRGVALDLACRSSVVVVDRCLFDRVGKILRHRMGDEIKLRDCVGRPANNPGVTPITTEWGRLILDGGIYTPPPNARDGFAMSWIEVVDTPEHGNLEKMVLVEGTRFGGEHGGMAVITNRSRGRTKFPSAPGVCITLRDLHASNAPSNADARNDPRRISPLVLLQAMPNHLVVDGCYGAAGRRLVDFHPSVSGGEVVRGFTATGLNNRSTLQLQRHNQVKPGEEVPEALRPFVVSPAAGRASGGRG